MILIRFGPALRPAKNCNDPVFRFSDHLVISLRIARIIAESYTFCFLRRKVSSFVDSFCRVSEQQDQTADDKEDDQAEDRMAKRTRCSDYDHKHQLSHPGSSFLGDLVQTEE